MADAKEIARAIGAGALCMLLWSAPALTQTLGESRTRIPSGDSASSLNNLLAAAQQAMDRKDYAAAAQNYEDYLAKQPNDAATHFQLGYAYTALQRPENAKAEYEKAIALDPKMQPAYLDLGLTLLQSDPAAAVEPLQKAAELAPDRAKPKLLLGNALERSGKLAPAIEQYQAAKKLDDKDFDIRLALGLALLKSDLNTDAESEFRAALALRPDSATSHWGLAQCFDAEKNRQGEADELALYLKTQSNDASAHLQRASALLNLGKNDDALAELNQENSGNAEDLPTLKLRARVDFELKRYDDTIAALQKAAALAPHDADIAAQLGHVYLEKKDYADAAKALIAAFKMNPQANDVLGELVTVQYINKNYAGTLEGIDVLAAREPLPPGTLFVRAVCLDKMEKPADALAAYQTFLQINKDQNSDMYFEATSRVRFLNLQLHKR